MTNTERAAIAGTAQRILVHRYPADKTGLSYATAIRAMKPEEEALTNQTTGLIPESPDLPQEGE